jgi:HSP20 family protein
VNQEKELMIMANLIPSNRRNRSIAPTGFEDFYNMLDDFFTDPWLTGQRTREAFKMDVQQTDKEYTIEAELPGVNKDEVSLEMNDGTLRISVNREESKNEEGKNYIHRERRYSSMSRAVYLGDAEADGISAKLDGGILKICVPRQKNADNTRRIEIQ